MLAARPCATEIAAEVPAYCSRLQRCQDTGSLVAVITNPMLALNGSVLWHATLHAAAKQSAASQFSSRLGPP